MYYHHQYYVLDIIIWAVVLAGSAVGLGTPVSPQTHG